MALIRQGEVSNLLPEVQQEVARLAAAPEVRSAYNWFRSQEPQLAHWQVEGNILYGLLCGYTIAKARQAKVTKVIAQRQATERLLSWPEPPFAPAPAR